jgi:AcrR family transcriptional regulator
VERLGWKILEPTHSYLDGDLVMAAQDPVATPAKPPRKRNSSRTMSEILTAAGRRFARGGYSKTSLTQIASEAGVTAAMVIHHFGSKAGLFEAVARDEWGLDDTLPAGRPDPHFIARSVVDYWNNADVRSPAFALVRSLDDANAVKLFQTEIERRHSVWLPAFFGPDRAEKLRLATGLDMGFGYFVTGALLNPDVAPLTVEQQDIMERYLARMFEVLLQD